MNNDGVVVIDIVARFKDQTSQGVNKTKKSVDKLGDSLKKTEDQMGKMSKNKWMVKLEAVDKATQTISKIYNGAKGFAGKTFKFSVKVLDYATKPLRGILNFATSIQGVITGILAGQAANAVIGTPIGLADSYTNAFIGFETLFKSKDEAQKMMDDLDQFAQETPFKTGEVIANTQKMIAMGWEKENIIPDMKTIGDAAAATGKGDDGLNSIVLALSQIKTKGKVSTEELNQLAEVGIKAKAYLAEGLGYGSNDEGMARLSKDLEDGKIYSEKALKSLLGGMKEYDGMMEKTANKTVTGLRGQLEDTFEISIFRKWGQGLQSGVIKGLTSLNKYLEKNQDKLNDLGDTLEDFAKNLSTDVVDGAKDLFDKITKITEKDSFQNATIGGKITILWDEFIANPFTEWWNTKAPQIAEKIAEVLGNALKKAFANLFSGSHFNIFGDGEKSWINTLVMAGLVTKGVGMAAPVAKTGGSLFKKGVEFLFGEGETGTAGATAGTAGATAGTAGATAGTAGATAGTAGATAGTAGATAGTAGATAGTAGATAGTAGATAGTAVSASTVVSVAGILSAAGGLVSAGIDLSKGNETVNTKEKQDYFVKSATKASMVAAGTGIGAIIGSVIPVVGTAVGASVGAGIGGAVAMFGGSSFGQWISDMADGTQQIRSAGEDLVESRKNLEESVFKDNSTNKLIDEYERLNARLQEGNLPLDERKKAQERINELVRELAGFYPDLITQYDIEHGKISANLDTLREISALEKERNRWNLENDVQKARETFEEKNIEEKIEVSDDKLKTDKEAAEKAQKMQADVSALNAEIEKAFLLQDRIEQEIEQEVKQEKDPKKREEQRQEKRQEKEQAWMDDYFYPLLEQANELSNQFGFHYQSLADFKENFAKELDEESKKYIASIVKEQERNDELRGNVQNLYDSEKALIETKLGLTASIEDLAANFDNLDAAQKDALKEAINQVLLLKEELNLLPEEKTLMINLKEQYFRYSGGSYVESQKSGQYKEKLKEDSNPSKKRQSTPFGSAKKYAKGGILTTPHLGLVAEAGAEAIIPLSASKRSRGLELWEKVGTLLGVKPYANGGIVGSISNTNQNNYNQIKSTPQIYHDNYDQINMSQSYYNDFGQIKNEPQSYISDNSASYQSQNENVAPISVDIGGMQFVFNGSDLKNEETVINAIRNQMPKIANELSGMIAKLLGRSYENMASAQV